MRGEHTLVIEDDRVSGDALVAMLQRHGFAAELATTVQTGLAALGSEPRCVMLDLMLPDGDGALVLASIRSRRLDSKVAIMTALADDSRLAVLQSLGADRIFRKPVTPQALLDWIANQGCAKHA